MTFAQIGIALWLASFAVVYLAVRFAPTGYETKDGFFYGEEGE